MRLALATTLALVLAASAAASPPQRALVVPGQSLGGLRLGQPKADVRAAWGDDYGVCRDCSALTWYYVYKPFVPQGAAVEFRRGRISALWTLWSPPGWHTPQGLLVGDNEGRITEIYGPLTRTTCVDSYGLLLPKGRTVTTFYVVHGRVWGFGLSRPGARSCR